MRSDEVLLLWERSELKRLGNRTLRQAWTGCVNTDAMQDLRPKKRRWTDPGDRRVLLRQDTQLLYDPCSR
jgi:hypothetical protein